MWASSWFVHTFCVQEPVVQADINGLKLSQCPRRAKLSYRSYPTSIHKPFSSIVYSFIIWEQGFFYFSWPACANRVHRGAKADRTLLLVGRLRFWGSHPLFFLVLAFCLFTSVGAYFQFSHFSHSTLLQFRLGFLMWSLSILASAFYSFVVLRTLLM